MLCSEFVLAHVLSNFRFERLSVKYVHTGKNKIEPTVVSLVRLCPVKFRLL